MDSTKKTKTTPSKTSVLRQLAALQKMSIVELQEKWKDLYGTEPPQYKKAFLVKRLAYRIQELFYGGLSEQAKSYLQNVAKSDPIASVQRKISEEPKAPKETIAGTRFVRIWNEERHEVIARISNEGKDIFEYNGCIFTSLSAVAREITGTRWNGKVFFGLKKSQGKKDAINA